MSIQVNTLQQDIYVITNNDDVIVTTIPNNLFGQSAILFKDEGQALGTQGTVNEIDFTGSAVTSSRSGNKVTVNISSSSGSGDVTGPSSSVDSSLVQFNGTTGKAIKDGGVVLSPYIKTLLNDIDATTARNTLGSVPFLFYKNNTISTLTTTTNEIVMDFFFVPANTFGATDIHRIMCTSTKVGANGVLNMRFRVGVNLPTIGSTIPSGTTQFAIFATSSGNLYAPMQRNWIFHSLTSQSILPTASSVGTETVIGNSSYSTTIDFTIDQYIMFTFQLANGADVASIRTVHYEILR